MVWSQLEIDSLLLNYLFGSDIGNVFAMNLGETKYQLLQLFES